MRESLWKRPWTLDGGDAYTYGAFMGTYTKLAQSIIYSSLWDQDDHTRLVWLTLLAMCDKDGEIMGTPRGIARAARVPVPAVERALEIFLAPDPDSSDPANEGRRLEIVTGGWGLLNHRKYRDMLSRDERLARDAERKRVSRAAKRGASTDSPSSPKTSSMSDIRSDQIRSDQIKKKKTTPTGDGSPSDGVKPRKPSLKKTLSMVDEHPALLEIPDLRAEIGRWRGCLPSKKVWASPAALERHLKRLEDRPRQALAAVRLSADNAWTDPVHAFDYLDRDKTRAEKTPPAKPKSRSKMNVY